MAFRAAPAWTITGLLLAAAPGAAVADSAAAPFSATTLHIWAHGEAPAVPDRATITLGVQALAPTAAQAMAGDSAQMTAVLRALAQVGVPERDVQTTNLSLSAQYAYSDGKPPALTGYQANNDVVITVEDLGRLGAVADAATSAGANQISGISLGLNDPAAAEDAARLAAMKALAAKAQLYADAAGYRIVRLVSLSETSGPSSGPVPMMVVSAARRKTPIAAGETTIGVDVEAVYELAK